MKASAYQNENNPAGSQPENRRERNKQWKMGNCKTFHEFNSTEVASKMLCLTKVRGGKKPQNFRG